MERKMPYDFEAEKATLGSMMIDSEAIGKAVDIVEVSDFYKDAHKLICEAMMEVFDNSKEVDLITISDYLRNNEKLEGIGGASYLTAIINTVPTSANVEYYANIVKEKATLRKLIMKGNKISQLGYSTEEELANLIDQAEREIFEMSQGNSKDDYSHIKELSMEATDHLEFLQKNKGEVNGVATGYHDLDKMTTGFQKSDLIIIAARPSMGKTALALNIAENAAMKNNKSIGLFSLEMSKKQLTQRVISSNSMVDAHRMRTGFLNEKDWTKITHSTAKLSECNIMIDDTPAITVMEMRSKARRMKAENGLDMIIIDYLQLMSAKAESRTQAVEQISRGLKSIARELDVPVVALSQLSRAVEQRNDKRPQLSDLRNSGSIEQDADIVMFLYRDDYYNTDTERPGITEIIIGKQRNGPVGTVELLFLKEFTRFENLRR